MADKMAGRARPGAVAFVLLTVALSWSIWIMTWFATGHPETIRTSVGMVVAVYAGSFVPGVVAAILSAMSQPGSMKEWLRGFIRFRCGWRTYAAALLPFPLALLLLTFTFGYSPRIEGLHGQAPILLYLTMFPVSIFNGVATAILGAGPLGEEGGWRAICCLDCWSRVARCAHRSSSVSSGGSGTCRSWRCSPTGGAAFPSLPISHSTSLGPSVCLS